MPLHRRLHSDMADTSDNHVRMRVFDLTEDGREIGRVRIEADMIEHLQSGFRQAFEITGVEWSGPGGVLTHNNGGLQMKWTD